MRSVFLSSAEASGDHYMAEIITALRANGFDGELWGMGASESRAAGADIVWQGEQLQLFGLTEVFSSIPRILRLLRETAQSVVRRNPDAVVVVDSPDYHLRLLAKLRKYGYGGPVFYVSPPTVWAWRSGRVKYLRRYVTECFPLYGFEHEYFAAHGCNSYWDGAPLLEEFVKRGETKIPDEFAGNDKIVAFMPGSRRSEVTKLIPVMEQAAEILSARGWQPVFSVAQGLNQEARGQLIKTLDEKGLRHFDGSGRELLRAAQCSVSASGTITVESLLLEKYMVSVYKMSPLSGFIANLVVKPGLPAGCFSMTNIIAREEIFPELFQNECTAEAVADKALEWLEGGGDFRATVLEKLKQTKAKLGTAGVYERWAKRITERIKC